MENWRKHLKEMAAQVDLHAGLENKISNDQIFTWAKLDHEEREAIDKWLTEESRDRDKSREHTIRQVGLDPEDYEEKFDHDWEILDPALEKLVYYFDDADKYLDLQGRNEEEFQALIQEWMPTWIFNGKGHVDPHQWIAERLSGVDMSVFWTGGYTQAMRRELGLPEDPNSVSPPPAGPPANLRGL